MSDSSSSRFKRNGARNFKNPPQPHMCIQDQLKGGTTPCFINVLSWDKVDMPANPDQPLPLYGGMKISPPRSETRHVLVFAVIANPSILMQRGKNAKNFKEQSSFIHVLLDFVETMNRDITFERKYTILKDQDIKGELKEIWISVQNQREKDNSINHQETSTNPPIQNTSPPQSVEQQNQSQRMYQQQQPAPQIYSQTLYSQQFQPHPPEQYHQNQAHIMVHQHPPHYQPQALPQNKQLVPNTLNIPNHPPQYPANVLYTPMDRLYNTTQSYNYNEENTIQKQLKVNKAKFPGMRKSCAMNPNSWKKRSYSEEDKIDSNQVYNFENVGASDGSWLRKKNRGWSSNHLNQSETRLNQTVAVGQFWDNQERVVNNEFQNLDLNPYNSYNHQNMEYQTHQPQQPINNQIQADYSRMPPPLHTDYYDPQMYANDKNPVNTKGIIRKSFASNEAMKTSHKHKVPTPAAIRNSQNTEESSDSVEVKPKSPIKVLQRETNSNSNQKSFDFVDNCNVQKITDLDKEKKKFREENNHELWKSTDTGSNITIMKNICGEKSLEERKGPLIESLRKRRKALESKTFNESIVSDDGHHRSPTHPINDVQNSEKSQYLKCKSENSRRTQSTVNCFIKSVFKINHGNNSSGDDLGKRSKSNGPTKNFKVSGNDTEETHQGYTILKKSDIDMSILNETEDLANDFAQVTVTDTL